LVNSYIQKPEIKRYALTSEFERRKRGKPIEQVIGISLVWTYDRGDIIIRLFINTENQTNKLKLPRREDKLRKSESNTALLTICGNQK